MENIEQVAAKYTSAGALSKAYFDYVHGLTQALDSAEIDAVAAALARAREAGTTVFVAGNGGSAALAAHMAADLSGAVFKAGSERPLRVLSIADDTAMLTAASNDFGYEQVFARQLGVHYRVGDILLAISASGNSANVVAAAQWVRERDGEVIGLLGFDGGALKALCSAAIVVRSQKGDYGPVEDVHGMLNHVFTLLMHLPFSKPR